VDIQDVTDLLQWVAILGLLIMVLAVSSKR
jgi:hypothetical protein